MNSMLQAVIFLIFIISVILLPAMIFIPWIRLPFVIASLSIGLIMIVIAKLAQKNDSITESNDKNKFNPEDWKWTEGK